MKTEALVMVLVVLVVGAQSIAIAKLRFDNSHMKAAIEHPITGYKAKLDNCQATSAYLERQIAKQNEAVEQLAKVEAAKLAQVKAAVRKAEDRASAELAKAKTISEFVATGDDVCARVRSIDKAFMETIR